MKEFLLIPFSKLSVGLLLLFLDSIGTLEILVVLLSLSHFFKDRGRCNALYIFFLFFFLEGVLRNKVWVL